ncbi:bacteriohemerythrin [uncultured Rhodospira sp.]|uniref:bacteriohemerythrin n=1 Tax=uncultured Rhodospira sp. TaxID=1936189 RepID=UPI002618CEEA|nr:bacteriohemerythrin [uncultured Rhodospira sp.]
MGGQDHKEVASDVIAAAEQAVSSLNGRQTTRQTQLHKLNELFTVVEQRYQSMVQDLHSKDEQIRVLESVNQALISALQTLTERVRENVDAMEREDSEVVTAISRSEALVSEVFGTGGNANPTQPPDTPPAPDLEPEPEPEVAVADEAGTDDSDIEDLELAEPADTGADTDPEPIQTDSNPDDAAADELVFEEALPSDPTQRAEDEDIAAVDPPTADPAPGMDTDLDMVDVADADEEIPLLEWTERWSVGVPEMDKDHRILINLINQLGQAFRAPESDWVVGSVLNSLWDYAAYHFEREEALLRAANFPGAEEHALRHSTLKNQVREWLDAYQNNPESVTAQDLQASLKSWLVNHVLGEDMRYKPYVEHNTDAQAIAAAMTVDPELLESLRDAADIEDTAIQHA